MKIFAADLGSCGANYQKDYLLGNLVKHFEFTEDLQEADIVLMLGGCCCTEPQMYQTIDFIQYLLDNKRKDAATYLTGCITRTFKDIPKLQEIEKFLRTNIDYVISHYEPNKLLKLICEQEFELFDDDGFAMVDYDDVCADIYVQNGCTHNCSFCKTNYINYNLKDASLEEIKESIDALDAKKIKSIQLRGLNLSQYGLALYRDYKLMDVCEYIEGKSNIKQVILSGVAFSDAISAQFADRLKYLEKTSCIVGSLESGSNRLLSLMNKGFTKEQFLDFYYDVNSIYKKKFWLNIISGFPTETIDDCLETINVIKEVKPQLVHINTYCDSEFIPAHNLEQPTAKEIREHTKIYTKVFKNYSIPYKINNPN